MQLNFERKKMSNEDFIAIDEEFRSFTNEYGDIELAYNPVFYCEDKINEIKIFFVPWTLDGVDNSNERADVAFVQCKEGMFRFYFQKFFPGQIFEQNLIPSRVIWSIFNIEILEFFNIVNTDFLVKKYIENIGGIFKAYEDPDHKRNDYMVKIIYVDDYFEHAPISIMKNLKW